MSDLQKDSGFSFESRSTLIYDLAFEQKTAMEKTSSSGQFLHSAQKNYLKSQKMLANEEIIEIVGTFFEKADCSLRTGFKNQLFKVIENKVQSIQDDVTPIRPDLAKLTSEFKNLKAKFLSSDDFKVISLK